MKIKIQDTAFLIILALLLISALLFPISFIVLFLIIAPLLAWVGWRFSKYVAIGIFIVYALCVLFFNRDLLLIWGLVPLLLASGAIFIGIQRGYRMCAAISALACAAGIILTAACGVIILDKEASQIVGDYLKVPENKAFVWFARDYYNSNVEEDEREELDEQSLVSFWANNIQREAELSIPYYLFAFSAIFACLSPLIARQLLKAMEKQELEKRGIKISESFSELTLPREYGFLLIPLLSANLLTMIIKDDVFTMLSETFFFSLILAPMGFCGITFIWFLTGLSKKRKVLIPLRILFFSLCALCVLEPNFFAIFSLIGFADYMIDSRQIIKKL